MPRMVNSQSGIAIGPILFIIAILAILAATIAASSGSFTSGTTKESDKIVAAAIIQSMESTADTVQLLIGRGCTENQLSFFSDTPAGTFYTNASAPVDGSCDIYGAGGKQVMIPMPESGFVSQPAYPDSQFWRYPYFTGRGMMTLGTGAADLIMYYMYLKQSTCIEINNRLGVSNPSGVPPVVTGTCSHAQSFFDGTYQDNSVTWCGITNVTAACVYDPDSSYNLYYYYKALLVR